MLVGGASGHAKEILDLLQRQNQLDHLYFYDDVTANAPDYFYQFPIIKHFQDLVEVFKNDNRFLLGLGGTNTRASLSKKIQEAGGILHSIISDSSRISHFDVSIGSGVNIMEFVLISSSVNIGEGSLINAYASIHHDVTIGSYCEISPRATLLGGVFIDDYTSIGSSATILPNVRIGKNVTIGAGSVVTKNIPDNCLVVGVPGRIVNKIPPVIAD
ncbi:MAG: acetyltransferase [Ignavibacterium sp.]|nr:acetyltransferase [Ignavibacterium sp.]